MSLIEFTDLISKHVELSNREKVLIQTSLKIKRFPKGKTLLKKGMISNNSYFNLKGCVRQYFKIKGEERTTFFYQEGEFISAIRSLTNQYPSDFYLECVEDCSLIEIPLATETELLNKISKLETFARISLENELGNYQEMLSNYILLNPEERYLDLLKKRPHLIQRVPLYQIASYLGIKPESLSRIRNRLAGKLS